MPTIATWCLINTAGPPAGKCSRIKGPKHLLMAGFWLMMAMATPVA